MLVFPYKGYGIQIGKIRLEEYYESSIKCEIRISCTMFNGKLFSTHPKNSQGQYIENQGKQQEKEAYYQMKNT